MGACNFANNLKVWKFGKIKAFRKIKMEDVLIEEPVLTPIKNGQRHGDIFEQIKNRAKAKQDVQNVQSFRAQLVKNESSRISEQSKITKEIRQKAIEERKRDKVVEKPIQKHF